MDDRANAYFTAVENFEKATRAVSSDLGAQAVPADAQVAVSTVAATTGPFRCLASTLLFSFSDNNLR